MDTRRKVKFEYYEVVFRKRADPDNMPDRSFDLLRWFDKVARLSLAERTYDYYQERARLENVYYNQDFGYWFLHFVRLRDTNLPSKATENTEVEPLELGDDEYIGEEISALYDEKLKVLMCQRNRDSLSISGIERYLNLTWRSDDETIYLRPIILPDSIQRAKEAGYYRKLTIRFADLRKKAFKEGRSPLKRIVDAFGAYEAVGAEITINLGHLRGDSLHRETVHDTINDIVENRDLITKAELSEKKDDDTSVEIIDLFDEKLHDYAWIPVQKRKPMAHSDIAFAMTEKYRDKRQIIASILLMGSEKHA